MHYEQNAETELFGFFQEEKHPDIGLDHAEEPVKQDLSTL
jgi:hypothetical protein